MVLMADSLAKRVGRHVALLRNARGWNQEQLAEACGISRGQVSDVEAARYENLGLDTLERICLSLSVSVKEFFDSMPGG